ncbi:hypothetical protein OG205_43105 [Lentzea sp. NBC_00516]|uniref:hypothetical protein n=1 Tax=Lentzea sp. NBC_00516 TaxID=2903582 RepID=UPI002E81C9BB|nr:hypothetical protein [Lentzea sp. NBC_00516]WUD24749.1 hypothetical protein OG205_43105 [Lentzea sp. NBC_00516]
MFKREQGARSVRAVARLAVAAAFVAGALITGTAGAQAAPAEQAAPVAAAACTQVGNVSGTVSAFTLYDSNNYTGACITFWKYGACTASTSDIEGAWNLAGWSWDNRANSVRTYNKCDLMLFDARDCPGGGTRSTWIDQSADLRLGSINWQNRASCVQIS